jgi:Uma2 family endonuclease
MNALPKLKMSLEEFLAWENAQPERHEFHQGEVFAMGGARRVHGLVVANLAREVGNRLKGSACRVFSETMKVQVAESTVLYPDIFVTRDKADLATEMIFRAPQVVVEVLSPSTQAYDRSHKFALYRRLASLREYLLVDPDSRRVESFRLGTEGQWVFHDMSDGSHLQLPSLGVEVALAEVFDGIDAPT